MIRLNNRSDQLGRNADTDAVINEQASKTSRYILLEQRSLKYGCTKAGRQLIANGRELVSLPSDPFSSVLV
ncbi:hypothetical protein JYU34_001922 [Plutella xylostella]|uniref:Uncharacterized protein n=1 Tax=Plutella xylostella TaxID=51655 RepID=A0ABQ7R588_PLUXY|nr:hypothetical protein JYU34_001922 [Plutella xylostella]